MSKDSGLSDVPSHEDEDGPLVPEEVLEGIDEASDGEFASEEEVRDAFLSE